MAILAMVYVFDLSGNRKQLLFGSREVHYHCSVPERIDHWEGDGHAINSFTAAFVPPGSWDTERLASAT